MVTTEEKALAMADERSGDYYDESKLRYYCVAFMNDEPIVIGSYTKMIELQNPDAKKEVSKQIWRTWLEGKK